jgi:hypothetical protein
MTMKKQVLLIALSSALALGTATVSFAQDGPGAGNPAVKSGDPLPAPSGNSKMAPQGTRGLYNQAPTTQVPSSRNNGNANGPSDQ